MRGLVNSLSQFALLGAGWLELSLYSIPIIAIVYSGMQTMIMLSNSVGRHWLQAFAFMAVAGSLWGFVPYFIGKFLGGLF